MAITFYRPAAVSIVDSSGSLVSFVIMKSNVYYQLGVCWTELDSNPAGVKFSGSAGGVSDYA